MTETWYVLEDGAVGDPAKIAPDADGRLRHEDGRAVAYSPHGPRSRGGVDAEKERAKAAAEAEDAAAKAKADAEKAKAKSKADGEGQAKEVKPEVSAEGYKTRENKAG